jgi:hypothetical protein
LTHILVVERRAPPGSILVPITVSETMIKRDDPISVSYTLWKETSFRILLFDSQGNVIKSFTPPIPEVGKTEVKSIGNWSEASKPVEYFLAYAVSDGKASDVLKTLGVNQQISSKHCYQPM